MITKKILKMVSEREREGGERVTTQLMYAFSFHYYDLLNNIIVIVLILGICCGLCKKCRRQKRSGNYMVSFFPASYTLATISSFFLPLLNAYSFSFLQPLKEMK